MSATTVTSPSALKRAVSEPTSHTLETGQASAARDRLANKDAYVIAPFWEPRITQLSENQCILTLVLRIVG